MNEVWSPDKCKTWLEKEVISGKTPLNVFQSRLIDWHIKQYADADNPSVLPWADQSLEVMNQVIKDLKLDEQPRRTLFSKLKEEASGGTATSGS